MKHLSNKRVAAGALTLAAGLIAFSPVVDTDPMINQDKAHHINAPESVEAGELAIFHVQGQDVSWSVHPELPIQEFGESDSSMATSFQRPGDYLVVCSFLDKNGEVQLRKHPVRVKAVDKPEVDVEVIPLPEPDPLPDTKFPEAAERVKDICKENNFDKDKASKIAGNFLNISRNIDVGKYQTVSSILRATADANRSVTEVNETTTRIQLMISSYRFDGLLRDALDYSDLWKQISSGLTDYVEDT